MKLTLLPGDNIIYNYKSVASTAQSIKQPVIHAHACIQGNDITYFWKISCQKSSW